MAKKTIKPPIVDTITKLRVILTGIIQSCDPPYVAYFEANRELPWEFIKLFVVADIADIAKEMVRPPGLRSTRHTRRGNKSKPLIKGIPDASQSIGKRLNAQELYDVLPAGAGRTGLFVISDYVDALSFTPVLIDMAANLAYDPIMGMVSSDPP